MALGVGALTRSTAHMPIDLSESRSYWGGSLRLSRPPPICHLSPFPLILSYSGERSFSALESERGKRGEKTSTKQIAEKKRNVIPATASLSLAIVSRAHEGSSWAWKLASCCRGSSSRSLRAEFVSYSAYACIVKTCFAHLKERTG